MHNGHMTARPQPGRDESSLEYAWNRYYSLTMGRFTTADLHSGCAVPQVSESWNRYSYVMGNPINLVDPDGLDATFRITVAGSMPGSMLGSRLQEIPTHVWHFDPWFCNEGFRERTSDTLRREPIDIRVIAQTRRDEPPRDLDVKLVEICTEAKRGEINRAREEFVRATHQSIVEDMGFAFIGGFISRIYGSEPAGGPAAPISGFAGGVVGGIFAASAAALWQSALAAYFIYRYEQETYSPRLAAMGEECTELVQSAAGDVGL